VPKAADVNEIIATPSRHNLIEGNLTTDAIGASACRPKVLDKMHHCQGNGTLRGCRRSPPAKANRLRAGSPT
jgi:hypothetical protein